MTTAVTARGQGPPENESARRSRGGEPEPKRFTNNNSGPAYSPPLTSPQVAVLYRLRRQRLAERIWPRVVITAMCPCALDDKAGR
jgi:hypothetical protein